MKKFLTLLFFVVTTFIYINCKSQCNNLVVGQGCVITNQALKGWINLSTDYKDGYQWFHADSSLWDNQFRYTFGSPGTGKVLTSDSRGVATWQNGGGIDSNFTNSHYWKLTGNSGLNSATNFIGTTDSTNVVIKSKNLSVATFRPDTTNLCIGYLSGGNVKNGTLGGYCIYTEGLDNTAFGCLALQMDSIGRDNTAIGYSALRYNQGCFNTAVGRETMKYNTTGEHNCGIGGHAMEYNTTGNFNTAIGVNALKTNTTGISNTALGESALMSSTVGVNNTAVGRLALYANTTGGNNIAVGYQALGASTNQDDNIAIGLQAMLGSTSGASNNLALGNLALYNCSGVYNMGIGNRANAFVTSGLYNIDIGFHIAGTGDNSLTTGSNNILIGHNLSVQSATGSDQISIGNVIFSSGGTGTGTTVGTGNVSIGTAVGHSSSILDLESTTRGFLPPQMTTSQKNAIASPKEGLIIYDTTLHKLCVYNGSAWETITSL